MFTQHTQLLLVARKVNIVVAFSFLPQNFGRWQGSMNGTLSYYEHSGGNQKILHHNDGVIHCSYKWIIFQ